MPWLMVAGAALQIAGKYAANVQQGMSELQNAEFFKAQAEMSHFTKQRELSLIARNYAVQYGQRSSAYAGGGVDTGSGSAAMVMGMTSARHAEEALAITKKYDLETRLARMRQNQAESTGEMLQSPGYNLLQAGTTALNAYNAYSAGGGGVSNTTNYNFVGAGPMSAGGGTFSGGSYLMGSSGGYGSP